MNKQNSGKIFSFELDHKLGYGFCLLIDHSDRFPLNGSIIYVYNFFKKKPAKPDEISLIEKSMFLFGPTPVNRTPITRGRHAWKYIGKTGKFSNKLPIFKSTRNIRTLNSSDDWSIAGGWFQKIDFNDIGESMNYDDLRHLEAEFLYSLSEIVIRATMHFLLNKGEQVEDYFDISRREYRSIYIQILNTSIDKKKATKLLKKLIKERSDGTRKMD